MQETIGKPFLKDNIPWNKGKHHSQLTKDKISKKNTGKKRSLEVKIKMSLAKKGKPFTQEHKDNMRKSFKKGANHHLWKGDGVGYSVLHRWVQKNLGVASVCVDCSSTSKVEWANISNKYKRVLDDWKQLCHSCHMKFDGIAEKVWKTRRERYGKSGFKPNWNRQRNNQGKFL